MTINCQHPEGVVNTQNVPEVGDSMRQKGTGGTEQLLAPASERGRVLMDPEPICGPRLD